MSQNFEPILNVTFM